MGCPPAERGGGSSSSERGDRAGREAQTGVTELAGPAAPFFHGVHVADEQPELHVAAGAGGEQQVVAGDAQGAPDRRQPRARQQHVLHCGRLDQLRELHGRCLCPARGEGERGNPAAHGPAGNPFPVRHCAGSAPLRLGIVTASTRGCDIPSPPAVGKLRHGGPSWLQRPPYGLCRREAIWDGNGIAGSSSGSFPAAPH